MGFIMREFLHIKNLQTRFMICYIFVIILPLLLLSGIIYSYLVNGIRSEYLSSKKEATISDKNFLENELEYIESYYYLFSSCNALTNILEDNKQAANKIVYNYLSQISTQLNYVYNADRSIKKIRIYTNNKIAARILTEFQPLSDLYPIIDFNSSISLKRELYRHFWKLDHVNGKLQMAYYAGFIYSSKPDISGVLEFTCDEDIFSNYINDSSNTSTYIYYNNSLVYSINSTTNANQYLKKNITELLNHKNVYVKLNSKDKLFVSAFSLASNSVHVVRIKHESFWALEMEPLLLNLLLCLAVFLLSNVIIFQTVFRPFQNISRLSTHIRKMKSPKLLPYDGPSPDDEIGELIRNFNQMADRTNNMAEILHNNEIQLKNAQIEALQSQLNPHFFYGTLESIRMIAEANQQSLISDIAFSFGNLMRYSLSQEYLVSIIREIDIVRQYLDIQSKRLLNRFTVNWDICPLEDKWRFPKFVLFSFVENVFSHDISQTRRLVNIKIRIFTKTDYVTIIVENDGPGITPERLAEIQDMLIHTEKRVHMSSSYNGRSLFNIHDRLQLFYGDCFDFSITSTANVNTICSLRLYKYLSGLSRKEEA